MAKYKPADEVLSMSNNISGKLSLSPVPVAAWVRLLHATLLRLALA